jgi:hypothetical protein
MIALPTQTSDRSPELRSRDDALRAVAAAQDVMRALVRVIEAMIEERSQEVSPDSSSEWEST